MLGGKVSSNNESSIQGKDADMKRVLPTGMSGTGKSSVIEELEEVLYYLETVEPLYMLDYISYV